MNSNELYSIREWAPLTDVLDRIPIRIKRGLFPADLNITCIDAIEEFLALGTDAGIVFWYNRQTGQMQKLKAETATRITSVNIVDSVEFMVAAGNSSGQVNVFAIQKEAPADLNLVAPCTKSKPIERYAIRDLHQSAITCCEWSKNAMKLYSGDRTGVVVLTEFDYQAHISKSIEILSETYEIVQLSAHKGFLLVSTLYRSIVCQRNMKSLAHDNWIITQIGKKDRKQLVDCGGTFFKLNNFSANSKSNRLICGRPNLRFWLADTEGNVEKTLLFREAVTQSPTWEIPILNPKFSQAKRNFLASSTMSAQVELPAIGEPRNFRNIYPYAGNENLIVTHDEKALYVLNLERLRVEAVAKGFRKIIDFCVYNKEIFVLEGERSLLRLAPMPEKPNRTAKIIYNPSLPPPVPALGLIDAFEAPIEYEPEEQPITNAEECFELPPIVTLNLQIPIELAVESSKAEQNRRLEVFKEISEMDFDDDILHHSGISAMKSSNKKRHKSRMNLNNQTEEKGIIEIGRAVMQDDRIASGFNDKKKLEFTTTSTKMEASFCLQDEEDSLCKTNLALDLKEALSQHLPNVLSPTTLNNTIAEKAKTLAEELNLPEVSLQPITAEELRLSKYYYLSQAPAPQTPQIISPLATVYPTGTILKNTSIQTTPQKKIYYIEEQTITDFTNGQPIEDICHTLRATNLMESSNAVDKQIAGESRNDDTQTNRPLSFINSQPENNHEIDSFLLDFKRARDPLGKPESAKAENESSNGSSSEWEFLDN